MSNVTELLRSMSTARDLRPQLFSSRKVTAKGKDYILLSRSVVCSMIIDGQFQEGLLIFGDQNPLGRSNYARKVFNGQAQSKDIRWLYFKNKTGAVNWLGNIVINPSDNTDVIKVFLNAEYDKEKKLLTIIYDRSVVPF
jgi:hypothetical protein